MEELGGRVKDIEGKVGGIGGMKDFKSEERRFDGSNSNILESTLRLTSIIIIFHKIWYLNINTTLHTLSEVELVKLYKLGSPNARDRKKIL